MNVMAVNNSLAYQRLLISLSVWEQDKHTLGCDWLYVCARYQGKELRTLWIPGNENSIDFIKSKWDDVAIQATSFELEMLHSPQQQSLSPTNKNQWNSLRGKRAMLINYGGKVSYWSATGMIARNLSFPGALGRHLAGIGSDQKKDTNIPVTLYQTRQLFCDNQEPTDGQIHPVEMFRGNRIICIEDITRESVVRCAKKMASWLAGQINSDGAANYKYWPSRNEYASSNNAIRQWMATVCLNRVARASGNQNLAEIAKRNLAYNLTSSFRRDHNHGYIWMNDSAKLGAAALAALAIFESPQRKSYLKEEYALYELLQGLSNPDGSFDTFYIPRARKDNQNFYSGEALLFLATRYFVGRNPDELGRIMAAFNYYRNWHRENRNPAFVPWHTQAYYLVWQISKNVSLKDFIFEMNDWLLSMQQWETAEFPDMQGRFYDPARPHFGPPHASSTGVYLEGLIDAFSLAKQVGDVARIERYRIAIVRGIRSLMQLQYKDAVDCFYVEENARVLGGVRTTVYDNTIRIDNVQHGLMALLKICNLFSESDFGLAEKISTTQSVSARKASFHLYKHFKNIDFPIDIEGICQEVENNSALWFENTSRQQNIKVQRETHSIFLRAAKKPFPPGVSGNDIHDSLETKNASLYPKLMSTLYAYAESVDAELSRVTVVRLLPGSRVYPHVDEGEYYACRDRYHIVVKSPAGSEMISGGERVVWKEGEFWWFDNKAIHEAYNSGLDFRVHVIFDLLPKKHSFDKNKTKANSTSEGNVNAN